MGGTSFDAALVTNGEPLVMTDGVVDRWRIALPMIDIHTIGAGGGSIARVDAGGMLQVGPQSAGAEPGPACYGRGGTLPTTTDADLVLGFLADGSFLGGGMPLDRAAAARAIDEHVAQPLGLSLEHAAAGIYDIVNVTMATGVREVSVRRGLDPRDLPLVVAGGAGPVHAAAIAAELEIPLLVVPRESSIFCAAGMLMSDFKHDFVRAYKTPLAGVDDARLRGLLAEMEAEGRAVLEREGVGADGVSIRTALDLRYVGQWHELTVPIEGTGIAAIEAAFGSAARSPLRLLVARQPGRAPGRADDGARLDGEAADDAARGRRDDGRRGRAQRHAARVGPGGPRAARDAGLRRPRARRRRPARRPRHRRAREHDDRRARRVPALRRRLRHVRPGRRRRARARRRRASQRRCARDALRRHRHRSARARHRREPRSRRVPGARARSRRECRGGRGSAPGARRPRRRRAVAAGSDAIFLILPDSPDIFAVVGEIGDDFAAGSVVVIISTVSPETPVELGRQLAPRGVDVLDCPISGGPVARRGRRARRDGRRRRGRRSSAIRPALEAIGSSVVHVGPLGHGQIAKLANNLMGAVIIEGIAEGLALAAKAGADVQRVSEAIAGGSGSSWILREWVPETVFAGDYARRFSLDLMCKDMRIISAFAEELGVPVPGVEVARAAFERAVAAGVRERRLQPRDPAARRARRAPISGARSA